METAKQRAPKTRYYWYAFEYNNAGGGRTRQTGVSFVHPFEVFFDHYLKDSTTQEARVVDADILDWKEISAEQFKYYQEKIEGFFNPNFETEETSTWIGTPR
jgi:hypothetical protein